MICLPGLRSSIAARGMAGLSPVAAERRSATSLASTAPLSPASLASCSNTSVACITAGSSPSMWIVWSRADTPTPSAARILRRCWSRGPKMVSSRLESTTGTVERGMRCRQRRPAGRKRWLDGAMRTRPLTPPDASIAAASPEHHTRATQPSALCKRDGSSSPVQAGRVLEPRSGLGEAEVPPALEDPSRSLLRH
jgi:hypothetical protein